MSKEKEPLTMLQKLTEQSKIVHRKVEIVQHYLKLKSQAEVDEYLTIEKREFSLDFREAQLEFLTAFSFQKIKALLDSVVLMRTALEGIESDALMTGDRSTERAAAVVLTKVDVLEERFNR